MLLDAGVELDSLYTADITRTLPGHRHLHRGAATRLRGRARGGGCGVRDRAARHPVPRDPRRGDEGDRARTAEWGFLPVSAEESLEPDAQYHRRYMVHGTSHHLGIDVHDCAQARRELYLDGVLEPGMVFTIEPGLYFQPDDLTVPEEYRGIGVRIEDDILVTDDGAENLSVGIPRTADDVEAWLARASDSAPRALDALLGACYASAARAPLLARLAQLLLDLAARLDGLLVLRIALGGVVDRIASAGRGAAPRRRGRRGTPRYRRARARARSRTGASGPSGANAPVDERRVHDRELLRRDELRRAIGCSRESISSAVTPAGRRAPHRSRASTMLCQRTCAMTASTSRPCRRSRAATSFERCERDIEPGEVVRGQRRALDRDVEQPRVLAVHLPPSRAAHARRPARASPRPRPTDSGGTPIAALLHEQRAGRPWRSRSGRATSGVKPSALATLDIETAARPPASASSTATSTMRSMLISRFGPRCGFAATPQASATARGSSGSASGCSVMLTQS